MYMCVLCLYQVSGHVYVCFMFIPSEWSCICVFNGYRFGLCFYDFTVKIWNCSDSVIFLGFNILWIYL